MTPATLLWLIALAAPPSPERVIEGLQRSYDATDDLKADFEQVYTYKVGGLTKRSTGRIFVQKPGRMRFDYLTPNKRHFISDGQSFWVYEPDQAQAFQESLEGSQSTAILNLLLGGGDLKEDFVASLLAADEGGRVRLQLIPREPAGAFRRVVLTLDPNSYRVLGVEWEDPTGNGNRMRLSSLKANVGLPAEGFAFTPPPGTRVIKAPEAPR